MQRVPVAGLVREIGRQSGAEIVGDVRTPRDVSQEFYALPLADALARLLGEQNFTLRYGPEGDLRKIDLLGGPLALAATPAVPEDARSRDHRPPTPLNRRVEVRSSSETLPDVRGGVTVAGTGTATGGAPKSRDTSNRSPEAAASLGESSAQQATSQGPSSDENWPAPDELDRKLRRSFLNFAQYFSTPEGQRAQALLEDFATNHPPGSSSDKANDILDRILKQANQVPGDTAEEPGMLSAPR